MATEVFDPLTADPEEIKARFNASVTQDPAVPRNADGTFKKQEEVPTEKFEVGEVVEDDKGVSHVVKAIDANGQVTESEPEQLEATYQARIDLGDGSGVQVFSGASQSELIDKLTKAQENATRKIKELSAQVPKPTHKERSADEEFALAQELVSKPTAAFKKLFEEEVGMPLSEFKSTAEAVKAFNFNRAVDNAANKFLELTPDFYPEPGNRKKMIAYLEKMNLDPTSVNNITTAYRDLNNDGLLKQKPAAKTQEEIVAEEARPTVVIKKKTSSGLSTRGASAPIIKKPPTTLEEVELETANMSPAEIKARYNKQQYAAKDPYDF